MFAVYIVALMTGPLALAGTFEQVDDPLHTELTPQTLSSPGDGSELRGDILLSSLFLPDVVSPVRPAMYALIEGHGPLPGLSEWVRGQSHLEELSLICICLSDADVTAVSSLPRLKRLDLRGCVVSETQLDQLCSVKTLRELDLRGAAVSLKSQHELRSRFPHLAIRANRDSP